MLKFIITVAIILSSLSALAATTNCGVYVAAMEEETFKVEKLKLARRLLKKGYHLTTKDEATFRLSINFGMACGDEESYIYSTSMALHDQDERFLGGSEALAGIWGELFARKSVANSTAKTALKRLMKQLPHCY